MSNNDNHNVKVGIFVTIGVTLFLISIIVFGGDTAFFKDYVTFHGKFKQVQGLEAGSVVTIAGLKVGNVRNLDLSPEGDIIVSFTVEKEMAHRVTENSLASVKTQGALGDKYIFISVATGSALTPESYINVDNKPDLIDTISDKSSDFAAIAEVIKELQILLSNLNKDDRSALLMQNLVKASSELSPTINRFRSILEKMDQGKGSLGALINDPVLHDKLISLLGDSPRNKYLKPLIRATIEKNESSN